VALLYSGVWQNHDHRPAARGDRPIDGIRQREHRGVRLGGGRVAVQEIDHGISLAGVGRVARRQIDDHGPVRRVALEVALERSAVNRDAFERAASLRRLLARD
jgi:hypothetical protein